jgi:hypothetical protein
MEKVSLEFSAQHSLSALSNIIVVITLDETGKSYTAEKANELLGNKEKLPSLPKRVLKAFTENAINKILSKEEIPNESGMMVLDGYSYEIKISKGDIYKEYDADDASIETYPLLRYLASWCRKQ